MGVIELDDSDSEEQSSCMGGKTLSRQAIGKRKERLPTSAPKSGVVENK